MICIPACTWLVPEASTAAPGAADVSSWGAAAVAGRRSLSAAGVGTWAVLLMVVPPRAAYPRRGDAEGGGANEGPSVTGD
ncbi:unnamed protein product [Acanthoscelides obtectus]|uniref:Uncharacterized protein n=1 Tax=Acanthoscelides obtectus TaxID=200917 RepID=A0A9P0MDV3_ACAOB|nr:unnamed protein product [Acanthoscelides obtectus]CAK1626666.1 hypothetical protein AOBTE_LOCUS4016 [Acanthoscelides obtectus]